MHDANCNQVEFGIWGTGSAELSLKEKVKQLEMSDNVMFHGPYSRADQQEVLNVCDIALVRLVEGMYGLGVPSKSYNILAAGKPILYIGVLNDEILPTKRDPQEEVHIGGDYKAVVPQNLIGRNHIDYNSFIRNVLIPKVIEALNLIDRNPKL